MSNGKKLKKMVQNGQAMNNQQVDPNPNGEIIPGDGVEEPRGLVGLFIKGIRFGRKAWNKTPTIVKYGLGAAVLVGTGAAGARIGYNVASKKYKPELPDNEDFDDEETYDDCEDFDDKEDYVAAINVDACDSPVTIANTGEIPITTTTTETETE